MRKPAYTDPPHAALLLVKTVCELVHAFLLATCHQTPAITASFFTMCRNIQKIQHVLLCQKFEEAIAFSSPCDQILEITAFLLTICHNILEITAFFFSMCHVILKFTSFIFTMCHTILEITIVFFAMCHKTLEITASSSPHAIKSYKL